MSLTCTHCDAKKCTAKHDLAEDLTAAIRKKGSDALTVRDAVHEACHAIQWGITGKWSRTNVDRNNPHKSRRQKAFGVLDEITARAVEALVMSKLGLEYDQDKWVSMMIMETLKIDRIALPSFDWVKDAIVERMGTRVAEALATNIINQDWEMP